MKKLLSFFLAMMLLIMPCYGLEVLREDAIPIAAPSACLMEKVTGQLLYEKDAHTPRSIASVTKVMTLLLIMEAIEAGTITWETEVIASANAASMGGSQIWLEEGEKMTVAEMVKCITVVSANDCCVAMAEHLRGSEGAFVADMNAKAAELGMRNTSFTNCTGLFDDPAHKSTAYDVALMARALIAHEAIKTYSTIWMDTARSGEFGLSNTNKLIYYYEGATGLKTGFTNGAKYCLAATAEREGTEYVAVVLGCDSSQERFDSAKALLTHGFANYALCDFSGAVALPPVPVMLGKAAMVQPVYGDVTAALLEKSTVGALRYVPELVGSVEAPVAAGQSLGLVKVYAGETPVTELQVVAECDVPRQSLWEIWLWMVGMML